MNSAELVQYSHLSLVQSVVDAGSAYRECMAAIRGDDNPTEGKGVRFAVFGRATEDLMAAVAAFVNPSLCSNDL